MSAELINPIVGIALAVVVMVSAGWLLARWDRQSQEDKAWRQWQAKADRNEDK